MEVQKQDFPYDIEFDDEVGEYVVRFKEYSVCGSGETKEAAILEAFSNLDFYLTAIYDQSRFN